MRLFFFFFSSSFFSDPAIMTEIQSRVDDENYNLLPQDSRDMLLESLINSSFARQQDNSNGNIDDLISKTLQELGSQMPLHQHDDVGCQLVPTPDSLSPELSPFYLEKDKISDNKFLKSFDFLKTNYLNLCETFNRLLTKLNLTTMENQEIHEENMELKRLLEASLADNHRLRQQLNKLGNYKQPLGTGIVIPVRKRQKTA
ncbi:uncharacterized protein PAS_chr3_1212 [Komagataella phaffii GS115]|uniref:Uncharacterized protein n=2 Tax=Komagataella phaffii TaxID=460519 RepID=C4R5D3_KOMPG|nr:uncharacterized protein PAS_chr3_1212 [Komagataella phaffii GS115]CAY70769.1 hypothetical protein PAS_chr3_1212 [Komagataella phaffii GS115]